jgi:orotidine-5'-phosphate decarboxylase
MRPFADRLIQACHAKGAPLCVGLDPRPDWLPPALLEGRRPTPRGQAAAFEAFGDGVIAAVAPVAAALKVNVAFYERLGIAGMRAYARTLKRARRAKLLSIADVKRGDIGSTAEAYAAAHLGKGDFRADAVTVNPMLGSDAMAPFLAACKAGAGLFVLVRTSNPGAADFQGSLEDPAGLSFRIAEHVRAWGEEVSGSSPLPT